MIDDEKSVQKERERKDARIGQLEQANQHLSDQIQEMHMRKEHEDLENARECAKLSNENEELLHALKELKLDMNERNEKIDEMGKEMSELKVQYENVKREGIVLE